MKAIACALILCSCSVGAIPDRGGESYVDVVLPLVQRCLPCHSSGESPDLRSFATLQPSYYAKPGAQSLLVTKGDHEGVSFLSTDDQAIVAAWIDELP